MNKANKAKENAEYNLKDRTIQYEQQLKTLNRNYNDVKENLQVLEVVNASLKKQNYTQEEELMHVPRLEETYLRKARSIVLEKERKITEKNILLKSQEKEIVNVNFWQNKAKALHEDMKIKDNEILSLKKQLTQLTHANLHEIKKGKHILIYIYIYIYHYYHYYYYRCCYYYYYHYYY